MKKLTKEQEAERWLYGYLGKVLRRERAGLVSYGLRFDPKSKQQYIGVDVEPTVSNTIIERVPRNVGDVDVRVRRASFHLE